MTDFMHADKFFSTARERYYIKLRRDEGQPWPWSGDPIFQEWRFCNVFREDDRTTTWFRENIRKHLTGMAVVKATVAFRWFNRIETAEHIKDLLLGEWDSEEAARRLDGIRPVVSGAYIIKGMDGMDKLSGVLQCIDTAFSLLPSMLDIRSWTTLRHAWTDLKQIPYLGPFMAAEVVQDLRWTDVLINATDINTWTNSGPGCTRGLGWTVAEDSHHFKRGSRSDQAAMVDVMKELLEMSRRRYWPVEWPAWELHTVEFWACEVWKYVRAQEGYRLKRRYRQ